MTDQGPGPGGEQHWDDENAPERFGRGIKRLGAPFSVRRIAVGALVVGLVLGLVGYGVAGLRGDDPQEQGTGTPASDAPSADPSVSLSQALATARKVYDGLTPQQRVGQLFVVGVTATGATKDELATLKSVAAGNVVLSKDSDLGVAKTREVTDALAEVTTYKTVRPFVAANQEGGQVQALTGKGFDTIPTGFAQGGLRLPQLRVSAKAWGEQLRTAGVNLDLAPVADVVPDSGGSDQSPVAGAKRQFGSAPQDVGDHVVAFSRGMADAGVATSASHFPGLGRASGDTDSEKDVTDPTTQQDSYLIPFIRAAKGGVPMVTVSSATYPAIDGDQQACFSTTVMRQMLRKQIGFMGVVVSDDMGSPAVASKEPGERAVDFFTAGGTLLLDQQASEVPAMATAVLSAAGDDPDFAALVKTNVLRVLVAKVRYGLVG